MGLKLKREYKLEWFFGRMKGYHSRDDKNNTY